MLNSKRRNPHIELLRIVAILLISLMHGIKCAYGSQVLINAATFVVINSVGNMGVTIFVLISGYFGISFRLAKLFRLWCILLFYSLVIFFTNIYISDSLLIDVIFTKTFLKGLFTAFTPITSNTWWFFSSYVILFMLSPLLNMASGKMTKQQFQYLIAVLLLFYSFSPTFLLHSLSNTPNGKSTENMIMVYLIGRYLFIHGVPKFIYQHTASIFGACTMLIFSINYFVFDPLFMAKDHNFFVIIGATCAFLYFLKLNTRLQQYEGLICEVATYVFPIYLINWSLINYFEPSYVCYCDDKSFLPRYLLAQIIVIVCSLAIEFIRRIIFDKVITKAEIYITNKTESITNHLFNV